MLSSGLRIPLLPLLLLLLRLMKLGWSFTDEDKKLIVDLHNQYRSKVSPPASDMLKLSWDPELEAFAKDYAAKCIWEHNKERGRRGENLFAMSGSLDVKTAVQHWYNEYQYYNMTTLTCEEGEMCGHYTQVVWATTERVGCGTNFCKTLTSLNDTDMYLVVCNYEPPGNVKGHKPYKEGVSCSMCPDGYSCKNSLCESTVDAQTTTESTTDDAETATASPDSATLEPASDLTASPTLQPTKTASAPSLPETVQTRTEESTVDAQATTESTTDEAETATASPDSATLEPASDLTASPTLQPTKTASAPSLAETVQTSTEESTVDAQRTTESTTDEAETATASPDSATLEPASDLTASPTLQPTKTASAPSLPETVQTSTLAESQYTTAEGPTSDLQPTSDLDLKTSPDLQVEAEATAASLVTTSDDLYKYKATTVHFEQPPTTLIPQHSTPKPHSRPKPPSIFKPVPIPPSTSRHPFFHRNFSSPKKPSISRKIPLHRLSAYAKAIKGKDNAVQSSAGATNTADLLIDPPRKDSEQPTCSKNSCFFCPLFLATPTPLSLPP